MNKFLAAHLKTKTYNPKEIQRLLNGFLRTYTELSEDAAASGALWEIRKVALGGIFDALLPQTNVDPPLYTPLKEAVLTHYATQKGVAAGGQSLTLETILAQVTAKPIKQSKEKRGSLRAPKPNPKYTSHSKKRRITRKNRRQIP